MRLLNNLILGENEASVLQHKCVALVLLNQSGMESVVWICEWITKSKQKVKGLDFCETWKNAMHFVSNFCDTRSSFEI